MKTVNKCTITETEETNSLIQLFANKYKGEEVAIPECEFCKRQTEYIVEPYPFTTPGMMLLIDSCRMPVIIHEGKAYFPVRHCWRCAAKWDGKVAGSGGQSGDVTKLDLTPEEMHEFFEIYSLAKVQKQNEIDSIHIEKEEKHTRYKK